MKPRRSNLVAAIVTATLCVALLTLLIAESRGDRPPANAWCEWRYPAAHSAAESLAVDQMLDTPNPGKRGLANPRFCGDFRVALERYRQQHGGATPDRQSP